MAFNRAGGGFSFQQEQVAQSSSSYLYSNSGVPSTNNTSMRRALPSSSSSTSSFSSNNSHQSTSRSPSPLLITLPQRPLLDSNRTLTLRLMLRLLHPLRMGTTLTRILLPSRLLTRNLTSLSGTCNISRACATLLTMLNIRHPSRPSRPLSTSNFLSNDRHTPSSHHSQEAAHPAQVVAVPPHDRQRRQQRLQPLLPVARPS